MLYISEKITVGRSHGGRGVFAVEPIQVGERIVRFPGAYQDRPGRHTLQVDEKRFIAPSGEADDFINHSCAPNAYVDFQDWSLRALLPIGPGEEVTFDYHTTEWEEPYPFDCRCGAPQCVGTVRGFRHLDRKRRERLLPYLSPFLLRRHLRSLISGTDRRAG